MKMHSHRLSDPAAASAAEAIVGMSNAHLAAQQLKITVDKDVLGGIVGQANAANKGATAGAISANLNLGVKGTPVTVVGQGATTGQVNLIDLILRMGQCLDETNVPELDAGSSCRPGPDACSSNRNCVRLTCPAIRYRCCVTAGSEW